MSGKTLKGEESKTIFYSGLFSNANYHYVGVTVMKDANILNDNECVHHQLDVDFIVATSNESKSSQTEAMLMYVCS